ncbi:MAG: DUF1573 domain-containing protein [Muribaculaceae bacterium]|nr:DUF1573 domain-containing protein [Muribaculaceae bacterium]
MLAVITKFKLTALLLMAGVAGASATGPFISLSTTDVSVGKAKATETLTDSVTIYNLGDSTLSITNVVTGCRCTSVALPYTSIAPGDSVVMTVRFHDPKQPPGRFRKMIRIRSNDPSSPTRLFISGTILPDRKL